MFVQSSGNIQRYVSGKTGEPVGLLLFRKPGRCRFIWWMVDGVPGGTDSARQKKKSERELDEERGHVQNTSQLLSDA